MGWGRAWPARGLARRDGCARLGAGRAVTAALAFLAAVFAVAGAAGLVPARPVRARLAGGRAARLMRLLAATGAALRQATGARAPLSLEQRIAAAGAPAGLGPRELIAAKLASMLCGSGVGTV
ncbi:MAG: hypothetical protein QOJ57_2352, partial [Thermoleophilaceae bacterium]|nr:hypothetical protein [Thermoleophilaceae bacterium]